MQRIGRASHHVGATSEGVIFPKYRGDLLACAAVTRAMHEGRVEATRYPRNPLDVLAQQIVAMVAMEPWPVDRLFARLRCAAPFEALSRADLRGRARHAVGPLPVRRVRRAARAPDLGPDRRACSRRARARSAWPSPTRARFPTAGSTASFWRARPRAPRASASSTRRWSSSRAWARRSCSAPRAGASRRSRTTACSSRPHPASPGKMPFWKGDGPARPRELGPGDRPAGARAARPAASGRRRSARARTRSRSSRRREPAAVHRRPGGGHRRRARRSHHRRRARRATSSATGACASVAARRPRADARGPWRWSRGSARRSASTSR